MEQTVKACQCCGKPVRGRSDKKFCDDYCRNNHNNNLKGSDNNYMRNVNNALRKNRRILQELTGQKGEPAKVTREQLIQSGFLFKYSTHSATSRKGEQLHYCYEYGYQPIEGERFLVMRQKGDSRVSK